MEVSSDGYISSRLHNSRLHNGRLHEEYDYQRDYRRVASPARSEGGHRAVTLDDMQRNLCRMKKELEVERARNRQYHHEREQETRRVKETYEHDWMRRLEMVEAKMRSEMEKKLATVQENASKEKDLELQQVLRYKDEETRRLQSQFKKEKDSAVRSAVHVERRRTLSGEGSMLGVSQSFDHDDDIVESLKSELDSVKSTNKELEEKYKKTCEENGAKAAELVNLREEYDKGLSRIVQESKLVVLRDLQSLKKQEKWLQKSETCSTGTSGDDGPLIKAEKAEHSKSKTPKPAARRKLLSKQEKTNIEAVLSATASTSLNRTFTLDDTSDTESAKRPNSSKSLHGYRPVIEDDEEIEELQEEVKHLESTLSVIKSENEGLKKKLEDHKPLEEKIRSLKRRNAELAAMARRLEEKAKHLQQENLKKSKETSHHDLDHMKRMFARQRARDLAEYAKNMLARDKEIEDLRMKCQQLAEQIGNHAIAVPENIQMYQEKEELENIIKQSAKERLLLERQVAKTKPDKLSEEVQESRVRIHSLEELNQGLEDDIVQLRQQVHFTHQLEGELADKSTECANLANHIDGVTLSLETERQKVHDLEEALQGETVKTTELTAEVSDLQLQLQELEKVEEEVQSLQTSLSHSQQECSVAKEQASNLQHSVQKLESECTTARTEATELQSEVDKLEALLKHLRECAEQHQQLENDHQVALCQLKEKQNEVTSLQKVQAQWKQETEEELNQSQSKLEQLTAELDVLALELERNKSKCSSSSSIAIQTERDESPVFLTNGHLSADNAEFSDFDQTGGEDFIQPSSVHLAESAKSLDTGFSEGEEEDPSSPPGDLQQVTPDIDRDLDPDLPKSEFVDPELSAISKRLRELEASASPAEDDSAHIISEGDQSSFMSGKYSNMNKSPNKMENGLITPNSRLTGRKGPLQVYVAKYSYDPYHYSPNDNPDAELPLNAGDYILIHGDMDEDGFFEGELIDGRRGLVPSNFIEKVADEDLSEFHSAMAMAGHHSNESSYNSLQHELDFNSSDESENAIKDLNVPPDNMVETKPEQVSNRSNGDIQGGKGDDSLSLSLSITDNSKLEKKRKDTDTKNIPYAVKLKLDRQLTTSVLVSWSPPEGAKPSEIQAYHVYLDGEFRTSVRATERTKSLVENVDTNRVHRVSVRTVTAQGHSDDCHCTLLIGKDAIPCPSKLEISHVSANSAQLSWLPGNSNYHHVIHVEGEEVRRVKPGLCSHTLTGLAPSKLHKVSVQAKNLTTNYEGSKRQQDLLTISAEFTTLAGGLPDPPLDVQVEAGPQEGTLLLTWLPVTINSVGTSNGAMVAGYAVYADSKKIREVNGPTTDYAVLRGDEFHGVIPKMLTVRTTAADMSESPDSNPVKIQSGLVQELSRGSATGLVQAAAAKLSQIKQTVDGDTDEEVEAAFREGETEEKGPTINPHYREEVMETSSSELSDIQEVEEENLSENHEDHDRQSPRPEKKSKASRHRDGGRSPKVQEPTQAANTSRIVPAIEITRDSSSERANSFETPVEEDKSSVQQSFQQQHSQDVSKSSQSSTDEPRPRKPSPGAKYSKDLDSRDGYRDSPIGEQPDSVASDDLENESVHRAKDSKHNGSHEYDNYSNHDNSDLMDQSEESVQELLSNDVITKRRIRNDIPESELIDYEDNGEGDSMAEAEPEEIFDDNHVRLFIALFDYDPYAMSPNVDAIEEELPFKEGQLIKVYGDKDADGFFRGECNGHMGYVPCNMVSEVQVDDPDIAAQLLQESQVPSSHRQTADREEEKTPTEELEEEELAMIDRKTTRLSPNGSPSATQELVMRKMVTLYDYDPQELSPNVDAEVELSFKAGDMIVIFGEMDEDGFFQGELNGLRGLVPSNFLQPMSPSDEIPTVTMDLKTRSTKESRHLELTNDVSSTRQISPEHFLNTSEDKKPPRRSKGIFAKGRNIFKKLAR